MLCFTKIELDVSNQKELQSAVDFAFKHKCPAIIVSPELVAQSILMRGIKQGKFKIISTIDYPKGNNYGPTKMRGMLIESLKADGFEIMLSGGSRTSIIKEVTILSKFMDGYMHPSTEIRYTIGVGNRTKDEINAMLEGLKGIPQPTLVRTTPYTKIKIIDGSPDRHTRTIENIHGRLNVPLKISGNINGDVIAQCKAAKYAQSLSQAIDLVNNLSKFENINNIVK